MSFASVVCFFAQVFGSPRGIIDPHFQTHVDSVPNPRPCVSLLLSAGREGPRPAPRQGAPAAAAPRQPRPGRRAARRGVGPAAGARPHPGPSTPPHRRPLPRPQGGRAPGQLFRVRTCMHLAPACNPISVVLPVDPRVPRQAWAPHAPWTLFAHSPCQKPLLGCMLGRRTIGRRRGYRWMVEQKFPPGNFSNALVTPRLLPAPAPDVRDVRLRRHPAPPQQTAADPREAAAAQCGGEVRPRHPFVPRRLSRSICAVIIAISSLRRLRTH